MRFEAPLFLLALVVLAAAVALGWWLLRRRRMRYAVRFTNIEVLAAVAGRGGAWRRFVPAALFVGALAALCVALSRPHVDRLIPVERATVILVIDTSRSMQAKDVKPTRLAAAQDAMRSFLDRVPDKVRVGLVVFAGDAQIGAPPTTDHDLVEDSIDHIGQFQTFGGTAIGDALADALEDTYKSLGSSLAREPGETEITFVFLAVAGGLLLLAGLLSALWSPRFP